MPSYYWSESKSEVPEDAVKVCEDEDCDVYVGRTFDGGYWKPVKCIPSKNVAYLMNGGQEIRKHEYHLLCGKYFFWVPVDGICLPPNAFIIANTSSDGGILYTGRVDTDDGYFLGTVDPSDGICCLIKDNMYIATTEYEILALR